jgi:predicted RNA-binding Zn ribbon-like protein
VDFDAYAQMAVDLVSTEPDERHPDDPLASADGLRQFLASRPWMASRARAADLGPLRDLRTELRAVFDDAAEHRSAEMVRRLNDLLERHPQRPSISGHDDSDWHLHVVPSEGPVDAEFAAGAVMGLALAFLDVGPDRFGTCAAEGCRRAFLDTSRNRSRRYCSERCATRENVAALRSRRRAGAGA